MGLFGTLKKLSDSVNKVADDFGKSTVEDYGPPVYTLYTAKGWDGSLRAISSD
jgi:hypothetical protein